MQHPPRPNLQSIMNIQRFQRLTMHEIRYPPSMTNALGSLTRSISRRSCKVSKLHCLRWATACRVAVIYASGKNNPPSHTSILFKLSRPAMRSSCTNRLEKLAIQPETAIALFTLYLLQWSGIEPEPVLSIFHVLMEEK